MSFMTDKIENFWLKKVVFNFLDTTVKNCRQQKNSISE